MIWDQVGIRGLRKRLRISQQQLAERCDCSLRTVGKWEAGEYLPNAIHQDRLSQLGEQAASQVGKQAESQARR
jgi:DNA-binding transcriptional regulator YiaG